MTKERPWDWHVRMREAIIQTFKVVNGDDWGHDPANNAVFGIDLLDELEKRPDAGLHLLKRQVMPSGLEMYLSIDETLTSLPAIADAVNVLLYEAREQFLIVIPYLDEEALRFWFATGSRTHGHIGEVIILREYLLHIDVSNMEIDPQIIDDALAWKKSEK